MMQTNVSGQFSNKGWSQTALRCFKCYKFENKAKMSQVISYLVDLACNNEISMRVTPREICLELEIELVYNTLQKHEVLVLMDRIDNLIERFQTGEM